MQSHQTLPNKCGESVGDGGMKCMKMFKTEQELENHIKLSHKKESAQFNCNKCEKIFTTHTALKQHAQTKHELSSRIPVGHPQWAQDQNRREVQTRLNCSHCPAEFKSEPDLRCHMITHAKSITCNQCDEMFTTKQDQNHHVRTVHRVAPVGFTTVQRPCRHFLQGWCTKGQMCSFSHILPNNQWPQREQEQEVPTCRRGPGCTFWAQGTCYYFHPRGGGVGVEQEHRGGRQQERRPCHFQERCWNPHCQYTHEDFGQSTEFLENY